IGQEGQIFITGEVDGKKSTSFAKDYLLKAEKDNIKEVDSISIVAKKNGADGVINTLAINLNKAGSSNVFVQSSDFVWLYGISTAIKDYLNKRGSWLLNL